MTRAEARQKQREIIMEIRAEEQLRRAIAEAKRQAGGIELDQQCFEKSGPLATPPARSQDVGRS